MKLPLNASEIPEEYVEYAVTVREERVEISECKKKIVHIKGIKFCKECGQKIKDNMNFCPSCGAKLPEMEESADIDNGEKQVVPVETELVNE